jgi:hypothetical protein
MDDFTANSNGAFCEFCYRGIPIMGLEESKLKHNLNVLSTMLQLLMNSTTIEFENMCRNGDIEKVKVNITESPLMLNRGLAGACIGGHIELVELIIERSDDLDWNLGLCGACIGGHSDIALLMIEKGANDLKFSLYGACLHGHQELVELVITKLYSVPLISSDVDSIPQISYGESTLSGRGFLLGNTEDFSRKRQKFLHSISNIFDTINEENSDDMSDEIMGDEMSDEIMGDMKLLDMAIETMIIPSIMDSNFGMPLANCWNWGLFGASLGGHLELVELMIKYGNQGDGFTAIELGFGLSGACLGGHIEVVELFIKRDVKYWNIGLCSACMGFSNAQSALGIGLDHLKIGKLMLDKGAISVKDGLEYLCQYGLDDSDMADQLELAELMINKGSHKFEEVIELVQDNPIMTNFLKEQLEKHRDSHPHWNSHL